MMLDRIVEVFCEVDDFSQASLPQWEASLLGAGGPAPRGPQPGLSPSEIITLLLTVQVSSISRASITASPSRWLLSRHAVLRALRRPAEKCLRAAGGLPRQSPGDQDRALLHRLHLSCDNHRISRHKVFAGLAQRGKTSMGWFFGFKLHLVFNNDNEIVALKLTPGNVHDTTAVPALTRDLIGKLFGDKGYIGQKLAQDLLRRGLTLFTRVRRNMKSLPMSLHDKALLNARNMAETIIGHIKEFSSLNVFKHRSVINAFVHIIAAITAYQINPFKPTLNLQPSVPMMGSWPVLVNQYSGPIFWGMELLSCLLPDSTSLHPVSWHLDPHLDPDQATAALSLISQQPAPECPLCHVAARRLHSRYERADLPWAGWTVRLELGVRKLFCDNPDCGRRIFTERLPGVVAPWARRTLRLGKRLTTVALGGSAGARLSRDLGIAQHAAAVDPCGAPAGLPNPDGPGRR